MKKFIINLITALAFIVVVYMLTQLYGCATQGDFVKHEIIVPDYTQYQAYPVTIIKKPGSITIYNSRPTLTLPYTQIKVAPPPTTIYITY